MFVMPIKRKYDAEQSRRALLDAAEAMFSERGFDSVSLEEICKAAGLARGMPAYFFGSKEGLYVAVLARVSEPVLQLVLGLKTQFEAMRTEPRAAIESAIETYIDFLAANPSTMRLIDREARDGGRFISGMPVLSQILRESVDALTNVIGLDHFDEVRARHFLISLMGLCWFPFSHDATFIRALGSAVGDPDFVKERKEHVTKMLLLTLSNAGVDDV